MDKINRFKKVKKEWTAFQSNNKKVRIRDAANQMKVSEAELLSTEVGADTFYLSVDNIEHFFKELFSVDKIMLLIRSNVVVHEVVVKPKSLQLQGDKILNIEDNKSLVLSFNDNLFKHIFYQKKVHSNKELRSFQIFDKKGAAVLKIYLKGQDKSIFDQIALKYMVSYEYELQLDFKLSLVSDPKSNLIQKVDLYFINGEGILDSSEFKLKKAPLRQILDDVSKSRLPVQVHGVGEGTIQYYRGVIKNIIDYGPWINVIDKDFNLHVLENELSESIIINYEITDCNYCSIEFFDREGNHVLGITSVYGYEEDFNNIMNNLKDIK